MNDKVKKQILAIRSSGITNMLDIPRVQYIVNELGYYELIVYLIEHKAEYSRFILTGKADET